MPAVERHGERVEAYPIPHLKRCISCSNVPGRISYCTSTVSHFDLLKLSYFVYRTWGIWSLVATRWVLLLDSRVEVLRSTHTLRKIEIDCPMIARMLTF